MILINEWLPNPAGADVSGEWIELANTGGASVSLSGWTLQNSSGKKFIINNEIIPAQGYLVLQRSETKLTLKNQGESLFLYNARGELVDSSSFPGTAIEGKSYSRIGAMNNFAFADPSPGVANSVQALALMQSTYTTGIIPGTTLGTANVMFLAVGCGALLAALSLTMLKKHHEFSKLFFGRN